MTGSAAAATRADPMTPLRYRVTAARAELGDVATLALEPVDGPIAPFRAGQFNMLYAFGVGEAAISISGAPGGDGPLVHTIRDVGAVSHALATARPGDMLGVRGPFGSDWPVAEQTGRHLLFVAGGLGLAPLRPAILQALASGQDFDGITILLGARSPADLLYPDETARWVTDHGIDLIVTVDHALPGWSGAVGVVTTRLARALAGRDPASISAFVCGPEIMMRFTAQDLAAAGVPASAIWLSMERNMKCAVGFCGHCQWGPDFVCKDGPVFRYDHIAHRLGLREI